MNSERKSAGPLHAVFPVVVCPAGIAVALLSSTFASRIGEILLFGPLVILVYLRLKGRKGRWNVAGIALAALPYLALIVDIIEGRPKTHIPL